MSNRFRFEAETRLVRWGESSSAGRTITLELPPDAGEGHPFKGFATGHSHGQRFRMQFDAIADDETNSPAGTSPSTAEKGAVSDPDNRSGPHPSRPSPAGEHKRQRYAAMSPAEQAVTRAALLPKDEQFRAWLSAKYYSDETPAIIDEETAVRSLRNLCCDCNSRKLIAEVPEYMDRFIQMETAYLMDTGQMSRPR